jgi:hypothetical protein
MEQHHAVSCAMPVLQLGCKLAQVQKITAFRWLHSSPAMYVMIRQEFALMGLILSFGNMGPLSAIDLILSSQTRPDDC